MKRHSDSYTVFGYRNYSSAIFYLIIVICTILFFSCEKIEITDYPNYPTKEELDERYFSEWNKPEYQKANTAKDITYLTEEEKEVFYYLNLARIAPSLFARTYLKDYEGDKGFNKGYAWFERKQSLMETLSEMEPVSLIYPDKAMYYLAKCFAYEAGKLGLMGHDRSQTSCSAGYNAECCQYGGAKNGLSIVMSLLIDAGENNEDLGHRKICLRDASYGMGVSIQPHTKYKFNAVLDFIYK